MFEITDKKMLSDDIGWFKVRAKEITDKAKPGQFVVVRIDEKGERIPLTIVDYASGELTLIVQEVGKTSRQMNLMQKGDVCADVIGPLGKPTEIEKLGTVVCVGGGIGVAPVFPIARGFKEAGNHVISIIGARSKDLLILEDEMRSVSDELYVTTDDGTYGRHGFVTDELKVHLDGDRKIDLTVGIGPVVMMRAVATVTEPYGVKTMVSLNPIMVDGTGMCGACRVTVGGVTKFVCVDGPDFDGHQVDFAELIARQSAYQEEEQRAMERVKQTS
jgi:NAD(P)H-flavin reductase